MNRPVIYVIVNKKLHMTAGKLAAQVGHAVARGVIASSMEAQGEWQTAMHQTMIVLEATSVKHMLFAKKYLDERGFVMHTVIDEGVNEVEPHSLTAMGSYILDKDDPNVDKAFSSFNLYRDPIKVTLEVER